MGAKEILLKDLCDSDHSGGTELIHNTLIVAGLKYKGPSNSQTLFYYFRKMYRGFLLIYFSSNL